MPLLRGAGRRRLRDEPKPEDRPGKMVNRMDGRMTLFNRKGNAMDAACRRESPDHCFTTADREAVYRAIFTRRDVRSQFRADPIDDAVLTRLLTAAHHAPSVGFMQPWNFIVLRDIKRREAVRDLFLAARQQELPNIATDRQELYRKLKLEGICESALNLCVTCDRQRSRNSPLGRWHNPQMDLFSTVCAVQNFWLAARAEGIGVGWVSIMDMEALKHLLAIPEHVVPIAYLCVGHVTEFAPKPDLEQANWRSRLPLGDLVMSETFGGQGEAALKASLESTQSPPR